MSFVADILSPRGGDNAESRYAVGIDSKRPWEIGGTTSAGADIVPLADSLHIRTFIIVDNVDDSYPGGGKK